MAPLARVRALGTLANLFTDYLPLSLHLVQPGKPGIWHALAPLPAGLHPVQFEIYFKRVAPRYAFHARSIRAARKARAPFMAEHRGLWDCVAPSGTPGWAVFAGPFLSALPSAAELKRRFAQVSAGRQAPPDTLLAYCRSVLETPVLPAAAQKALSFACAFAAEWHMHGHGPDAEKVEALKPLVARSVPWRMERFAEARRERLLWWAAQSQGMAEWDVRDFGFKRLPGAVLALAPAISGGDAVEDLVLAARLRQENFAFAVEHGLIAGRALGEGACLLAPGEPGSRRSAQALQDLAREAGAKLSQRLGAPVTVGWSQPLGGEQLPEAFRQAEWALLMALPTGRRALAYEAGQRGADANIEAHEAGMALHRAVLAGRTNEIATAKEAALGSAARLFPGRSDLLRPELLRLSLGLFDAVRERGLLSGAAWDEQRLDAVGALQEARSARELTAAFSALVDRLGQLSVSPRTGSARLRVKQTLRALEERSQPADLRSAAALAGLSASRFSRLYRREGGEAFGEQRRRKRLEAAAALLVQGGLPVWRVAQESGYRSASHFGQAFKGFYGRSPLAYRQALAKERHK